MRGIVKGLGHVVGVEVVQKLPDIAAEAEQALESSKACAPRAIDHIVAESHEDPELGVPRFRVRLGDG